MNGDIDRDPAPIELVDPQFARPFVLPPIARRRRRPLWPALILFLLTVISTLSVGSEFARSYAENREPFSGDQDLLALMALPFKNPALLRLGVPFSFTLLAILLAHELGHYFAAKTYGIDVSYPYFIPFPNLFGTFGAFIRIRSPITTKRAIFDVGLAGPVAGFLIALPAMAYGVATSKIVPGAEANADIVFGHPLLVRFFAATFFPHVDVTWILLNPVARAAWVGLFVTALNLLPAWQLDGGHVMFSLASEAHRKISIAVSVAVLAMGWLTTPHPHTAEEWSSMNWMSIWYLWGGLLLILTLRFRHPPVYDPWEPLDGTRRAWALVALVIFSVCFTPWPAT